MAFGTDESTALTAALMEHLVAGGHQVEVVANPQPWPDVGARVGAAVSDGRADLGVVCCWTGTGVSIAANKVNGIRAALCTDAETARGARRWNDANVLALSLRLISDQVGKEIVDAFLSTDADPEEQATIRQVGP